MLLQVIAKFDPMKVNVKDIAKSLEDAGIEPNEVKITTAREQAKPKGRNAAGGRKGATSATAQDAA